MEYKLGINIKRLREAAGLTQSDFSKKLNERFDLNTDRAMISKWETGFQIPVINTIAQIAEYFGVSIEKLLDWNRKIDSLDMAVLKQFPGFNPSEGTLEDYIKRLNTPADTVAPLREPLTAGAWVPVLGRVPAGVPIEAVEDIIDKVQLNERMTSNGHEYFALLVTGDSMFPEYKDGDIVIVKKQSTADSGKDVVAYVNSHDATLKRYIESEAGITLRALNPAYETKTYSHDEVDTLPVRLLGVVVEQRRSR